MFLGAILNSDQMSAVKDLMDGPAQAKYPSFYGSKPNEKMKKQFGAVISPHLLGAAEVFAETNHPIYQDVATSCAQRLPHSVVKNMVGGACQ